MTDRQTRTAVKKPCILESNIQRAILAALTLRRVWCWRVNSGAMVVGGGPERRFVKLAPPGTPDILGVLPDGTGRLFGLEVKTATGKQSVAQIAWQKRAEESGVNYRVVRSVAEALAAVDEWM